MKILVRKSASGQWRKLEPFEFGGPDGELQLQTMLEKSPDLLTAQGGQPVLFFRSKVRLGNNEIDLLGVDAEGTIVMVECKLQANREARRMVVGQILEYAGQLCGTSYEDFEGMLNSDLGSSFVESVRQNVTDEGWAEADFQAEVRRRLDSGDFRLVIAINGINDELMGIVEYLKKRGGVRLEVLELQEFRDDSSGVEVLVPELYGSEGQTPVSRSHQHWDWESFSEDAAQKGLSTDQIQAIKDFYDAVAKLGEIRWGTGSTFGWFGPKLPFTSGSIVQVTSYGRLTFCFGSLGKSDAERIFREKLKELAIHKLGLTIPEDYQRRYPSYEFDWTEKTALLVESLKAISC